MQAGLEPKLIYDEKGRLYGINFSSDACCEHETGIEKMRSYLGINADIPDEDGFGPMNILYLIARRIGSLFGIKSDEENDKVGIRARTVRIFNRSDFFFERSITHTCLTFQPELLYVKHSGWNNYGLEKHPKTLSAAWDNKSFGIIVENEHGKFIEDLFKAFSIKDVAIYFGGSEFLMAPGLIIAIASRVPEEIKKKMYDADMSEARLEEAVKKEGASEKLAAAGKLYFGLSPRWKDDSEKEVLYWLNQYDQDNDNFGLFTLQDLLDWTKGKGPIPKQKELMKGIVK
ncbi:MAG: hypothetical protein WC788_07420 [Candidatus Paceibacterota bacterium]